MKRASILNLVSIALVAVAACHRGGPFGPDNQPEFSNDTNLFEWRATAMDNITETQNFTWQTTGSRAVVYADPELVQGHAHLSIWGASARPVFATDLEVRGSVATALDTAGAWTIEVRLSGVSGSLGITVSSQ